MYKLVNRRYWKKPTAPQADGIIDRRQGSLLPTAPQSENRRPHRPSNNTHINNTHFLLSNDNKTTKSRPNEDINKIIETLKKSTGLSQLDGTIKENRRYAYLLIKKWKDVDIICAAISVGVQNKFHSVKMTNVKYLYYHLAEIGRESIKKNNQEVFIS